MADFDEQRPQRTGYSDLNERQQEGVPAIDADEAAGKPADLPDLSATGGSGEASRADETATADDRDAGDATSDATGAASDRTAFDR